MRRARCFVAPGQPTIPGMANVRYGSGSIIVPILIEQQTYTQVKQWVSRTPPLGRASRLPAHSMLCNHCETICGQCKKKERTIATSGIRVMRRAR